jgi:hypothetical protein
MAAPSTAPAWRRAFLRELARTGSVKLAEEKCGICRTSAYQARRKNPAFAASWDRALASARERLSPRAGGDLGQQGATRPEAPARAGAPRLRDDEFVRASKTGKPCVARAGPGRWSRAAERTFLAQLAATANVKAAARAAGVSAEAVYARRKKWPAFAAAWAEAKAQGYEQLELSLIHAATATLDPEPEIATAEAPVMSVAEALALLKLHRASQHGGKPQRYGWRQQEPDIEEVRAEILRKVAAMERARGG